MTDVLFTPAGPLRGAVSAAPDKSLSHRAALLAAMGTDPVRVRGFLRGADTLSTLAAVRALGAQVTEHPDGELTIVGVGLRGAGAVPDGIDVGNAGTLMRLLPGWLAGQGTGSWSLDGDSSIRRRPVDRVAVPLRLMGARIEAREERLPPFTVFGGTLDGIEYRLPVASAQIKSCVLIAGLLADGPTTVVEPEPSRDHTERLLLGAGVPIGRSGDRITVRGVDELALEVIDVPGDPSSAAFHAAAAAVIPGSRVRLQEMGTNWTRVGFLQILRRMGGDVRGPLEEPGSALVGHEPIADVEVAWAPLQGTTVDADEVPLAIDELPLVALLGAFAEGETVVRGARELRVKESDRIAAVVDGLSGLGVRIEALEDGFVVHGRAGGGADALRGGHLAAGGDHRMAMLGAIAGLASSDGVTVHGMDAAVVSYPGFEDDLAGLIDGGVAV